MLLILNCSDKTTWKIDKHVFNVPLTLMMGRRYFLCICSQEVKTVDCNSAIVGSSPILPTLFACPRGLRCFPAKEVCQKAPKVRILPQTLCSHSLTDRMIGYGPIDPGSIPGGSVV